MLDILFQSKARSSLLEIFFSTEEKEWNISSLALISGFPKRVVEGEVKRLFNLGILKKGDEGMCVNEKFLLFPELRDLILKARLLVNRSFVDDILLLGNIKLFYLTGIFLSRRDLTHTDMLLVGKIQRRPFTRLIQKYEHDLGKELYYTIFEEKEYLYRLSIGDNFLYTILDYHPIVVYDTLSS